MSDKDSNNEIRISRRFISGHTIDLSTWATPDEGGLDEEKRQSYLNRKKAVTMFLSGASSEVIKKLTNIGAKQAYRLIRERCLETHPDGQLYGWRGLLRYEHIKAYTRIKPISYCPTGFGTAGALQALLNFRPELRHSFEERIRRSAIRGKTLQEINHTKKRHHLWFLDQLRELGYEARGEWPFGTQTLGYSSIKKYVTLILSSDPKLLASSIGGPDLVRKLKTGDGGNRPIQYFMQRVEMDAHKLDGRFCVVLPNIDGSFEEKIVHRLWVIVIIEVISRAVIGYYFSLRREISKDDVLRAIKSALIKWNLKNITFSDTAYLPDAGLLSTNDDRFVGLCWDETSVDGALAETCKVVKQTLQDAVGSVLLEPNNSFSVRRSKDDRPFIETFFRRIAGGGMQRLSNTTGAKPKNRKETLPEEIAITSRFQYEYGEEILNILIANYNVTPNKGIGYRTPLSYAKFLHENSNKKFRYTDPETVDSFFSVRKLCTVRGGAKNGRLPFVEFFYGRYSNEVLQNRQDLVGSKIWVISHKEYDARVARASTVDGLYLGVLRVSAPWSASPHSLSVRVAINQAVLNRYFSITSSADAIATFMDYVESQPKNRLPIHPAYLEVRRILFNSENSFIGDAMLEEAIERADKYENSNNKFSQKKKKNNSNSNNNLPPRRMARSE